MRSPAARKCRRYRVFRTGASCIAHVLFGKPLPTFPGHAPLPLRRPCGAAGFVAPQHESSCERARSDNNRTSDTRRTMATTAAPKQLLHLVLGGELTSI